MIPPFIPVAYRERAYIAGGWAACPALASDMDVWILATTQEANNPDFNLADLRAQVLNDIGPAVHEEDSLESGEYGGVEIKIRKVCRITPSSGVSLHLMVTDAPIIEAVLANFDISTHQIAVSPFGEVIFGNNWTPITELPKVIEERRNGQTEARLKKITERYASRR